MHCSLSIPQRTWKSSAKLPPIRRLQASGLTQSQLGTPRFGLSSTRNASNDAVKQQDVCKEPGMNIVARFANDESGATAIEYGLIAALIAVGIIAAASTLGGSLSSLFERISGKLNEGTTSGTGTGTGTGG
jgi:pilus assembly protein Flp/PilA